MRGPNSIAKYGPIGTLSMGFLILYLTLDLDNINMNIVIGPNADLCL